VLLIVPVSQHDTPLIPSFEGVVNFFGPYHENFELLVVARPSAYVQACGVFESLSKSFKHRSMHIFPQNGPIGWPAGPNFYWYHTILYLEKINYLAPWLWLEMDMTPIEENWIDTLYTEYLSYDHKPLGLLQTIPSGTHFVGAGIYPAYFHKNFHSWRKVMEQPDAFDYFCGPELREEAKQSKFMEHKFRTGHYRCTNQGLQGISEPNNIVYPEFFTPIARQTVLVHGCGDGSLASIILQDPSVIYNRDNSFYVNYTNAA
jgi:hypothetical protein